MTQRRSRTDIEQNLKAAGDSINRRISTIERTVRPPGLDAGLEAGRKIASNKTVRAGTVLVAGFIAGWWLGGIGARGRKGTPPERGGGSGLLAVVLGTLAREGAQTLAKGLLSEFSRRRSNRDAG